MPWYDTQGKIQTWVQGEQSTVFPLSPQGLVYPGDPGIPKTLAPTRYDNFGPRLGLAYSPSFSDGVLGKIFGGPGKSSVRASYGLYYTSVEDLNLFYEVGDAPFGLYWTSPGAVDFSEPFRNRLDGGTDGEGQRFPFTIPTPRQARQIRRLISRFTSRCLISRDTTFTISSRTLSTLISRSSVS